MVTGVFTATSVVGIVKGAEKLPAGMLTVAGGLANSELLVMLTTAPAAGA